MRRGSGGRRKNKIKEKEGRGESKGRGERVEEKRMGSVPKINCFVSLRAKPQSMLLSIDCGTI